MQKLASTLIFLVIIFVTAACSNNAGDNIAETVELTDISFQMNWIHEYSVAPIHVAVREGFFENEGLNVTLVPGGFDEEGNYIDPFAPVISGEAMFGLASSSQILQARNNGTPLVAIMTLLQRSPSIILSLEETGIQRPEDLIGKTLMVSEEDRFEIDILIEEQGIDPNSITFVPRTSFGIDPLLNGETDAMVAWIINEGVQVTEADHTPSYLVLSDYGIDSYSVLFFTTEDVVNNNPDIIQRFVNAVVAGIEFSVSNPEQAIDATLTFNDQLDRDAQLRRLNAMIPLMNVPGVSTGFMDETTWDFSYNLLRNNDLIGDLDPAMAFTTSFVENAAADSQ